MLHLLSCGTFCVFQHTAARRRLDFTHRAKLHIVGFQHTAARRRLGAKPIASRSRGLVSTHSRPKAAGTEMAKWAAWFAGGFNTQPPEGGWVRFADRLTATGRFNTQPPEGGWLQAVFLFSGAINVSTHSRPKAAGSVLF